MVSKKDCKDLERSVKVYNVHEMRMWIEKSNYVLFKAIIVLWRRQTTEEQCKFEACERNGIGFNKYDAPLMTEFASKILTRQGLTPKEIALARMRIRKYIKQLTQFANAGEKVSYFA
jgi:hypothetical protein